MFRTEPSDETVACSVAGWNHGHGRYQWHCNDCDEPFNIPTYVPGLDTRFGG